MSLEKNNLYKDDSLSDNSTDNIGNLQEHEIKLRDLLLISNDWIWEIDINGIFTFTSKQIEKILGYKPDEIIGKHISYIFLPEDKEKISKEISNLIAEEKPFKNRVNWNLSKDGRKVCLKTNGIPFFDKNGNLIGYLGVDKDITKEKLYEEELIKEIAERKKTEIKLIKTKEEAEAATFSKSLFLAKMSHEIRTPMNGIIGTIDILKDTILTGEQKDFLDIIDVSANNLLSIINDILDISKIEAGKVELENKNFNLYIIVDEIIKLLSFKASEKSLIIHKNISQEVPEFVIGDFVRLKQIIINLMNNAIKFTKKGSITLEIEKTKQVNNKIHLLFRIIDTGTGISEEGQKRLFQEFSQADISITRKYGGTGLGLIISKKLSKLMDGEIGVESKIGTGSTFWFTVVLETGSEIKKESEKKPMKEKQEISKKLSILVAEDNVINQKVAMINLKQLGHNVEIAVNGKMAVDMYNKNKYDLILMDIQMPVLDGIEATKEIRKIEKENNVSDKIKIVAITANAMKEDKNKCLSAGMDDYITKPFKSEDMDRALQID